TGTKTAPSTAQITWNQYFELRAKRRTYDRVFSIPTTLAALGTAGSYVANVTIDPTETIVGLDPLMAYGFCIVASGFGGFLLGPVMGTTAWRLTHPAISRSMEQRDEEFYRHIVKNRADASFNSIRNPVPDYYGEKIRSLKDYRKWLRKQREHQRKANF
ncbi:mitochondrial import protein Pam17, partial [Piptocephalis cylindrospora]